MRITSVKVVAFDSTQGIADDDTMAIGRSFSDDLATAVADDHDCEDHGTCDIRRALDEGFPRIAAGFLSGATECAHVDAVTCAHRFNGTADAFALGNVYALPEWSQWEAWFTDHATMCAACGGATFDAEGKCGHCRAPFPANDEDA